MGSGVQPQEGATRPLCACHGEPQWLGRRPGQYICAVRERERNARRIRVQVLGEPIFVGRAPSAESTDAIRGFIRQHKQEVRDGWLHA